MILETLRLKNFRNHADTTIAFTAGVNAVVGVNGCGKSSVIEAIRFLLFGDGYGTKQEMLKVGALTGSVEGTVLFDDGKTATIWRAVEASKVKLTYDGIDYIKATDVKALWDKLFQVDSNVFKNVNVASQGEIPLLFSGDEAVRRSVFQKVFMVPNTTPLRNTIWNDYIKKAPAEYITLSDLESDTKRKEVIAHAAEIEKINRTLAAITTLGADELTTTQQEIFKAKQSIEDARMAVLYKANIKDLEKLSVSIKKDIAAIDAELVGAPELSLLTAMEKTSIVQQAQNQQQKELRIKRDAVVAKLLPALEMEKRTNTRSDIVEAINCLVEEQNPHVITFNTQNVMINKLSCFKGHANCPTCGSELNDVTGIIAEAELQKKAANAEVARINKELIQARSDLKAVEAEISLQKSLQQQKEQYEGLLSDAPEYDAKAHHEISEAITKLTKLTNDKTAKENSLKLNEQALKNNKANLANLSVFTDARFLTAEDLIAWNEQLIRSHNDNLKTINTLKMDIQRRTILCDQIGKELAQSEVNKALNVKRKAYVDGLQRIYDVLHPTQFAAMLIRSYASTLQAKLHKYLSQFNFKYAVRVSEEFAIHVYNEDGELLPKVSGGQAMVIGLSLRLALHDMFSQSLSLFCCDEPTQGLDTENQSLLFELVQNLKQSGIKQIIIIDHNTGLSRVVDNCVTLEKTT